MRCTSIVWFCCIRALLAPESHDTSLADCLESVGVNAGCRACKALAQATIPSKPSKFDACQSLYYAGR